MNTPVELSNIFLYSQESMQRNSSVMTSPLRTHLTFAISTSHTEIISAKAKLLDAYVRELLRSTRRCPRTSCSASWSCAVWTPSSWRSPSLFTIPSLLLNTGPIPCSKTRSTGSMYVPPGHMVVWRFDIGLHAVQLAQGADMWSPRSDWQVLRVFAQVGQIICQM